MKKYIVTFQKTVVAQIAVEANTRDEAEKLAWKNGPYGAPMEWAGYNVVMKNCKMVSYTPEVINAQIPKTPQT